MSDQKPSVEHMKSWALTQAERGVYNQKTTKGKISALDGFISVLGDDEPKEDPKWILENLSSIANRYAVKYSAKTETTTEYTRRVKLLVDEYLRFLEDPKAFKPRSPMPTEKKDGTEAKAKPAKKATKESEEEVPESAAPKTGPGRFHSYPLKGGRIIEYRTDAGTDGKAPLMMDDLMRFTISFVSQAEDFDITNPDHQAILGLAKRITQHRPQLPSGE